MGRIIATQYISLDGVIKDPVGMLHGDACAPDEAPTPA